MEVQLVDCVKSAVYYIIENGNFNSSLDIDVKQGSAVGDGYVAKTYGITIKDKNNKTVQLFVKYLPEDITSQQKDIFVKYFQTEFYFYNEIYPVFKKFQENKSIKEPFDNVPNFYSINTKNCETPPIILENLKILGYKLRDKKELIDDHHLELPITAFARYHAISYAIKDQEPEVFQKLLRSSNFDVYTEVLHTMGMIDTIVKCCNQFLEGLDPISDKKCLDRCKNLSEVLSQHFLNISGSLDEYAVICQGDCQGSNNMMFLYDDKTGLPINVKLIDWQATWINSPLLDFSYYFYSLATKDVLDNADYYLNLYYNTLARRIEELGSDPKKMFPYDIFLEHWRKFALFGLSMAFCVVKMQLLEPDEAPDIRNSTESCLELFSRVIKYQDKYVDRMKDLVGYFIDKGFL